MRKVLDSPLWYLFWTFWATFWAGMALRITISELPNIQRGGSHILSATAMMIALVLLVACMVGNGRTYLRMTRKPNQ